MAGAGAIRQDGRRQAVGSAPAACCWAPRAAASSVGPRLLLRRVTGAHWRLLRPPSGGPRCAVVVATDLLTRGGGPRPCCGSLRWASVLLLAPGDRFVAPLSRASAVLPSTHSLWRSAAASYPPGASCGLLVARVFTRRGVCPPPAACGCPCGVLLPAVACVHPPPRRTSGRGTPARTA